jgi:hypothetical protein
MKAELLIIMFCIAMMTVSGCINHTSKVLVILEKGDTEITYRDENAYWSLLSITDIKDSEHVTPLSRTVIGEIKTASDPNSIESAGGMLGEILRAIVDR